MEQQLQRALELLEFYEGSVAVACEGAQPTVTLNAEDFNEILSNIRAISLSPVGSD